MQNQYDAPRESDTDRRAVDHGFVTRKRAYLAAIFCGAAALLLAWAAASRHPGLSVPPAVAYLGGWVFAVGALRCIHIALRPESPGDSFAALVMAGMVGIGGWIAWGSGERLCRSGVAPNPLGVTSGAGCRVPFGIGAAIALLMMLYAIARWVRLRRRQQGAVQ